ncbi:ATP-binding cassette domain-containing protein [Gracilibacillus sp. JCM 18860]|uniref:ATP-binding cassette domain-containing protein n=1 Tax=Gracilibacillus sp. JCM 18860 TaxID=1306159 RepID=UPI000A6D3940
MRTLMTQQYSKVPAVNDLSFKINAGETVGYLGPNGAGKSTMIKMLTGILVPTAGQLFVRGKIPHQSRMENARKMGGRFWTEKSIMVGVTYDRFI